MSEKPTKAREVVTKSKVETMLEEVGNMSLRIFDSTINCRFTNKWSQVSDILVLLNQMTL